jgi:hypothetical protein
MSNTNGANGGNGGERTALVASTPSSTISLSLAEKVLIGGDLSKLSPQERLQYYQGLCESFNLNPLSQPFQYLELQGKLTLYATKACASQLRDQKKVSIYKLEQEVSNDLYIVRAYARTPDGREDVDEGSVPLLKENGEWKSSSNGKRYFQGNGTFQELQGEELVNARLKAVTKAKRRVTLSICGLGFLDETEVETIKQARRVNVDHSTGEIVEGSATVVEQPESQDDPALTGRLTAAWETLREAGWEDQQINAQYRVAVGRMARFDRLSLPEKTKAVEHLEQVVAHERKKVLVDDAGGESGVEAKGDLDDIPF